MYQLPMLQLSRRDFLRAATTIGAVGCFGAHHAVAAAEPPPETTTIRLVHAPSICTAPQYIAEELLRLDGFSVMRRLPYNRWREDDPEDTLRFHALRLYEVGMIKTTPQKLIAQSTDWRILDELKQEMKG